MVWFSNPLFKAAAAIIGAAAVIGVAAAVMLNGGGGGGGTANNSAAQQEDQSQSEFIPDLPELPGENPDASAEDGLGIYGQLLEAHDPNITDAFYKISITVLEKDTFEASAQVSSTGVTESTYVSEELLFYDNRTEKCYILGRRVSYTALGAVTVTHTGGAFGGTMDYDAKGETCELYGDQIAEKENYLDYTALPVRADVKESTIFILVPTKDQEWVTTSIGGDVSAGPPMLFPPESLVYIDIGLIPGRSEINMERTYSSSDSVLDDLTGRLVKPSGTFICELVKIPEAEAMQAIAVFSSEIAEKESKDEFIPDLPPLPDENDVSVDNEQGLPLPEGYPQDVLPISDDVFIVTSETIPGESEENSGYSLTLKVDKSKQDALTEYQGIMDASQNASSFTANGISTLYGEKSGYSVSIMIMDNTLGGSEKTMIQIVMETLDN